MESIDLVVYWVDGSDPAWRAKRAQYDVSSSCDAGEIRYRDMGTLKYLMRGIDKFAPWVNRVFFVSDGQVPKWLDTSNPKLRVVDHRDYIPEKYLPTFSSHPIELNFHRIEGLSECFIPVNDDFFLTSPTKPEDFFVGGRPVDIFTEFPLQYKENYLFNRILFNNYSVIGKYFPDRAGYRKELKGRILSPRYGSYWFYNFITSLIPYSGFWGLTTPHFMRPYRKSDLARLWELEGDLLDRTCSHKFRSEEDVNIWLVRMFNLMNGDFVPGNIFSMGHAFMMKDDDDGIIRAIEGGRYKMICINDECDDETFGKMKERICAAFDKLLPDRCSFEKET